MKKTILATLITAASFASFNAAADVVIDPQPVNPPVNAEPIIVEPINNVAEKVELANEKFEQLGFNATIQQSANGDYNLIHSDGEVVQLSHMSDAEVVAMKNAAKVQIKQELVDVSPITPTVGEKVELANEAFEKMGLSATIQQSADGNYRLIHSNGEAVELSDLSNEEVTAMKNAAKVAIKQELVGVSPIEDPITIDPIEGEKPDDSTAKLVEALIEKGAELRGDYTGEAAQQAYAAAQQNAAQQQAQIDEIYAQGQQNTSDIATLFNEVDRLDARIDQTQALNAATVNARPMVTNGDTAFGAGVGYAGSEAAISVGVAHSFVDTGWSASATLAASSDDVVIGAGTQYTF